MFFIHFYFRLHDAVLDSGQDMVHETQHGEAKPNIPIINSHHFQAVDGDNVEYDREDSLLGHHKEDQRVPVYFQQVKVVLLIITLCSPKLYMPGTEPTSALGIWRESRTGGFSWTNVTE